MSDPEGDRLTGAASRAERNVAASAWSQRRLTLATLALALVGFAGFPGCFFAPGETRRQPAEPMEPSGDRHPRADSWQPSPDVGSVPGPATAAAPASEPLP